MPYKKRVLILISEKVGPNDRNWEFFRRSVANAIGPDIEIVMGELVGLTFEMSRDDSKVYSRELNFSLDDFDLVVFRFVRRELSLAASCASFLIEKGIPYIDSQVKPYQWSKYSAQAMRFAEGFANIPSVMSNTKELLFMVENDLIPIEYPIIIKDRNGKKGRCNFMAHNKQEASDILKQNLEVCFIVQEFIENDGDYRFLVMGGEIATVIHRKAQSDSHLNNTSQGASSTIVDAREFEDKILLDVELAARLENLEVAGVDLMIDKNTGQHYIVEVNSSPQLATGAAPDIKMKAYAKLLRNLLGS